jgi:hypothetical protein
MQHCDGRDRDDAIPVRLPRRDRPRLAQLQPAPPRRRPRQPVDAGSLIGLALSLGVLAGLAWLLAPADPVSSSLLR